MKNSVLAVVAGMFLFGCGGEETNSAKISQKEFAASTWFGGLSQGERNQRIINTASDFQYYGYGHLCNCKEWARDVVRSASYYQANIPPTCPDAYGWYWCPWGDQDVRHISYIPYQYPIYVATAGNIVQMNLGAGNPHTAIIWAKWSTGVCFIEANFYPCEARIRCQSLNEFISQAPNHTVYEITGQ